MHVDLALLRRGPLITDSRLVECQSSAPGEISLWFQKLLIFYQERENPNMRLMIIVLSLNFLHVLLPVRKSYP